MAFEDSLKQLQDLFAKQKYEALLEIGEDLLDDHSDQIDLFILLGKAALAVKNYADADYYLLKAKRIDSNATEPLFLLAALKVLLQDNIGAQEYYEKVLTIDKDNIPAMVAIADLFYVTTLYSAAIEQYTTALEKGAKEQLNAEQFALIIYKTASSYLVNNEAEEAIAFIDKYEPTEFQEMVWLVKRKVYIALQQNENILACTEILHKNKPTQASYIFDLVQYLNEKDHTARIKGLYDQLLQLELSEDEQCRALLGRAAIQSKQDNWAATLEDLTSLLAIKQDWFAYRKRSTAQENLKNIKEAIQDMSKAIALIESPYEPLFSQRGTLLLKAGLYDKAIADFNKVVTLSEKTNAEAFYNLGIAYNKKGDKTSAFKMLVQAEMLGYTKAKELLLKNFSAQLAKIRQKKSAEFGATFKNEVARNQKSPILAQAFDKPWIPNMSKFLKTIEEEMKTFPASIIKELLAEVAQDIFLITPEGILFSEGTDEPIEAYYKVEVESEHSILLELQPTKGGNTSNMSISIFEGNLLVTYPVGEIEVAPKYFVQASLLNQDQKTKLTNKTLDISYMDSIEKSIATIIAE